jgi:trk system potassium uptake protein TrkA
VVARIYDPGRAAIYQRLGIPTVGTVRWTSDQMLRRLLPQGSVPEHTDPSGHVVIADVAINPAWIGHRVVELEKTAGARVAYLTRLGDGLLPSTDTVYQDGDLIHMLTTASALTTVERILDQIPPAF